MYQVSDGPEVLRVSSSLAASIAERGSPQGLCCGPGVCRGDPGSLSTTLESRSVATRHNAQLSGVVDTWHRSAQIRPASQLLDIRLRSRPGGQRPRLVCASRPPGAGHFGSDRPRPGVERQGGCECRERQEVRDDSPSAATSTAPAEVVVPITITIATTIARPPVEAADPSRPRWCRVDRRH